MTSEILFDNLSNKTFIRFCAEDGSIDFLKYSIIMNVFDLATDKLIDSFNVELLVAETKQNQFNVFEFTIPKNVTSLKFEFISDVVSVDIIIGSAF